MAEESLVISTPVDPASLIIKRKRGRPRKEDGPGSESGRRRRNTYTCDISTGQVVSGVLDGKFDAGYMLTVHVGNTGTLMRGVVFEPGIIIPITPATDIAPHVSMIRRLELPVPIFELKNHTSLNDKDPLPTNLVDMASKVDCNSMTGRVKVESNMGPVVNQSSGIQQSVNQNYSMTVFEDDVSNVIPRNAIKVASYDSESRILHASEATLSGVNEKGQLLISEVILSDSKPGPTSLLSSAANFNPEAVNKCDNKFVESKIEFANQRATPVAIRSADARKEKTADLESQSPEKNKAVLFDTSPKLLVGSASSLKIEDFSKAQDNVLSTSVPEPNSNPK